MDFPSNATLALASLASKGGGCRECEGRGVRDVDVPGFWSGGFWNADMLGTEECPVCEGTGEERRG